MKKTPKAVNEVCDAIERELMDLVKSTKDNLLAKVNPGEETPAETSPDVSATSPAPPADGGPPPSLDGSPDAPPAPAGGDVPPEAVPGEEGAPGEEAPPSHEQMVDALRSLPPEQLQAWKAALDEVMAGSDAGGAPPPDAAPPAPELSAGGPPPDAMKSEKDLREAAAVLAKAETSLRSKDDEIVRLRAEVKATSERLAKQEEELSGAAKAIQDFLRQPNRRGGIAVPAVEASGPDPLAGLSKSEIDSKLRIVARRPNLTSAQRQALDNYVSTGGDADIVRSLVSGAQK